MSLWPLKIIVKLVLSWVPGRHKLMRNLGIFRHGEMDSPAYALKIFKLHAGTAFPNGLLKNFTALELGPGDSLMSALTASAHGAGQIYLADAGDFASTDIELYKKAADFLACQEGLNVPDIQGAQTTQEMLEICNARYLTDGLEDLKAIPERSVDFIWSHSVLEHVRKKDFEATMAELSRIVKKDGMISHNVDLQDHLDRALNNLRFPEKIWEHDIFAGAGFYTNRIGYSQSLELMRKSGAEILSTKAGRWEAMPTPKGKLAGEFQDIPEDELRVRTYSVLLRAA